MRGEFVGIVRERIRGSRGIFESARALGGGDERQPGSQCLDGLDLESRSDADRIDRDIERSIGGIEIVDQAMAARIRRQDGAIDSPADIAVNAELDR